MFLAYAYDDPGTGTITITSDLTPGRFRVAVNRVKGSNLWNAGSNPPVTGRVQTSTPSLALAQAPNSDSIAFFCGYNVPDQDQSFTAGTGFTQLSQVGGLSSALNNLMTMYDATPTIATTGAWTGADTTDTLMIGIEILAAKTLLVPPQYALKSLLAR